MDTTKTSVTLGWIKPAYDGGSPITHYVVEKREGEEQEWTVVSTKGEVRTTEYVVSHLQPSVNYYFRVSAMNCAGQGEPIEMMEPVQAKDILGTVFLCDLSFSCVFGGFFKPFLILHSKYALLIFYLFPQWHQRLIWMLLFGHLLSLKQVKMWK